MKRALIVTAAILLSGCATLPSAADETHSADHSHNHDDGHHHHSYLEAANIAFNAMPPGSNLRLREPITISNDLEVIISDVVIPPNATVPAHYHPGEEFLYVIEGSAIHVESGKEDQLLKAGDAYVIPPEAVHAPRGGPEGARAIVFRVHKQGKPERILVDDE
ncbi:MAG: cupin domain-containing protein [Pseudomonadota bacterium]